MRRIGHVENPRWRMLRVVAVLSVVTIAVASSLAALHASSASAGGNILSAGQELLAGQPLVSAGGQYTLVMQTDGNLVVYGNGCVMWASNTTGTGSNNYLAMQTDGNLVVYTSTGTPVWASGASKADQLCTSATMSAGKYLHSPSGQYTLDMQTDGNLVVYTSSGKPVWASNTAGTGSNNYLAMQTDGNLVVYTSTGTPVWASGASKADQLCTSATMSAGKYLHSPSGQYTLDMQTDGNLVVYTSAGKPVWASNTAGTGSNNSLVMQDDGNLVIYTSSGKPVWASNTAGSGSTSYESSVPTATAETFCPGTSALCQAAEGSVQGAVHMVCWQDATWTDGQSHRWFYIQAPSGSEGFVHAGSVASQIATPNCTTVSWVNAAAWAIGQDGQTTVPVNAKNGNNVTYWSSWCWLFSYDSWKLGAGHTPVYSASTAQQVWTLYSSHGRVHAASSMPPRGSLVFFSYGSAGHVAVSLGDGWVETTQGSVESQRRPVTHKTLAQVGLPELGYVPTSLI